MTYKANFNITRHIDVKSKTLAACVIATATMIAVMSITPISKQNVNAQMMMGGHSGFANMTSSMHELLHKRMTNNGTINLQQTIFDAFRSKLNISLTQAMTIAERAVGNNSFAVAGFGGDVRGYFAYQIILGTPRMEFYTLLVDPGNGHVLAMQKVSAAELDKMHQEHSAEVVRSGSGGAIGFPFLIPH
jgi:hypothetical protein